jgi:hypothetical protein
MQTISDCKIHYNGKRLGHSWPGDKMRFQQTSNTRQNLCRPLPSCLGLHCSPFLCLQPFGDHSPTTQFSPISPLPSAQLSPVHRSEIPCLQPSSARCFQPTLLPFPALRSLAPPALHTLHPTYHQASLSQTPVQHAPAGAHSSPSPDHSNRQPQPCHQLHLRLHLPTPP